MIPGEIITKDGAITLNAGRDVLTLKITNTGDRPVQVGSHFHFYETNEALDFDRESAKGFRLDIPAGTAVRFYCLARLGFHFDGVCSDRDDGCGAVSY